MLALIGAAIEAVSRGLEIISTNNSRKYIEELKDLREKLLKEEEQGYDSDDAYIEHLQNRIKITMEAAANELKLYQAKS